MLSFPLRCCGTKPAEKKRYRIGRGKNTHTFSLSGKVLAAYTRTHAYTRYIRTHAYTRYISVHACTRINMLHTRARINTRTVRMYTCVNILTCAHTHTLTNALQYTMLNQTRSLHHSRATLLITHTSYHIVHLRAPQRTA